VSSILASLDTETIAELVAKASAGKDGFGGKTLQLEVTGVPVFCKLVPLTDLESAPTNYESTANHFGLPLYYQYGIGSVGFGAWRELAAHAITSRWVIQGQHEQFPLMYHWRVIKCSETAPLEAQTYDYLAQAAALREDDSAIRQRLDALRDSRTEIAIFSEYIPRTLSQWLLEQLHCDRPSANAAVLFTEDMSIRAFDFMRSQGFIHFDTHLDNILTDGASLYFADFGLAAHKSFDLTADERNFLANHAEYDAARFGSSLVHTICRAMPGEDSWSQKLSRQTLQTESLPPAAIAALERHAPIALYMTRFAHTLINTDRHAIFSAPTAALA